MSIALEEKHAIKSYCTVARQIATAKEGFNDEVKQTKTVENARRNHAFDVLRATNVSCIPFAGQYARIKVCNSLRAVTEEVVLDALNLLEEEEEDDSTARAGESLVATVTRLVQQRRTTTREFIELSKFKPKGVAVFPDFAGSRAHEAVQQWQDAKVESDALKRKRKDATHDLVKEQQRAEAAVARYMNRSNLTSQRININEREGGTQTYFIRNKTSQTRPRITKEMVSKAVEESLAGQTAIDDVPGLARRIMEILDNRPAVEKKKISLVKGMLTTR